MDDLYCMNTYMFKISEYYSLFPYFSSSDQSLLLFKPVMCQPVASELIWSTTCVCVCVPAPKAINN